MPAGCCRSGELRGAAGGTVVISASASLAEDDIVRGPGRRGSIAVLVLQNSIAITILLCSWPVKIQGILLALRQLAQDGLDLGPRLV